jgi:ABC-type Fe3+-hydroxamate transport system substrate-binding protein
MFSYGGETIQGDCLRQAGLSNVLEDYRFGPNPTLNAEELLALAPEIVFLAGETSVPRRARRDELPAGIPWAAVPAHQRGAVFVVPAAWMASITHHALLSCRAYLDMAGVVLENRKAGAP